MAGYGEFWQDAYRGQEIKIKDLERQLDEAREEEIKFLRGLYIYEENISSSSEIRNRILKLKEKGK